MLRLRGTKCATTTGGNAGPIRGMPGVSSVMHGVSKSHVMSPNPNPILQVKIVDCGQLSIEGDQNQTDQPSQVPITSGLE